MSDESFETKDITSINVGVDDITSKLPRKIGRPKKFNFPKSSNPRTKRKYNHCLELTCSKCKGHDVYTLLKGHKNSCEYYNCKCDSCKKVDLNRHKYNMRRVQYDIDYIPGTENSTSSTDKEIQMILADKMTKKNKEKKKYSKGIKNKNKESKCTIDVNGTNKIFKKLIKNCFKTSSPLTSYDDSSNESLAKFIDYNSPTKTISSTCSGSSSITLSEDDRPLKTLHSMPNATTYQNMPSVRMPHLIPNQILTPPISPYDILPQVPLNSVNHMLKTNIPNVNQPLQPYSNTRCLNSNTNERDSYNDGGQYVMNNNTYTSNCINNTNTYNYYQYNQSNNCDQSQNLKNDYYNYNHNQLYNNTNNYYNYQSNELIHTNQHSDSITNYNISSNSNTNQANVIIDNKYPVYNTNNIIENQNRIKINQDLQMNIYNGMNINYNQNYQNYNNAIQLNYMNHYNNTNQSNYNEYRPSPVQYNNNCMEYNKSNTDMYNVNKIQNNSISHNSQHYQYPPNKNISCQNNINNSRESKLDLNFKRRTYKNSHLKHIANIIKNNPGFNKDICNNKQELNLDILNKFMQNSQPELPQSNSPKYIKSPNNELINKMFPHLPFRTKINLNNNANTINIKTDKTSSLSTNISTVKFNPVTDVENKKDQNEISVINYMSNDISKDNKLSIDAIQSIPVAVINDTSNSSQWIDMKTVDKSNINSFYKMKSHLLGFSDAYNINNTNNTNKVDNYYSMYCNGIGDKTIYTEPIVTNNNDLSTSLSKTFPVALNILLDEN